VHTHIAPIHSTMLLYGRCHRRILSPYIPKYTERHITKHHNEHTTYTTQCSCMQSQLWTVRATPELLQWCQIVIQCSVFNVLWLTHAKFLRGPRSLLPS